MKIETRILGALFVCAVALIVSGVEIGKPSVGIEGAYFGRPAGVPAFSGVFARTGTGLLDPADGNLWLGAGIAVLLVTAMLMVYLRPWRTLPQ